MSDAGGMLLDYLRRLVPSAGAVPTDAELLGRFAAAGDETAFEALVRRHGHMVWGACLRLLADATDAEDAFQATFFVLARKATAIGRRELVANWLHAVALRTARKVRCLRARRRSHERQVAIMPEPRLPTGDLWAEISQVLDLEVARLADKYRKPILLCYLEGMTRQEAAAALGWPPGTVAGRLARALELLRSRFARRGLALPAGVLAATLSERASAAVPAALLLSVTKAAPTIAAKGLMSTAVSASLAALTKGTLSAMNTARIMRTLTTLLVLGLLAASGVAVLSNVHAGNKSGNGQLTANATGAASTDQRQAKDKTQQKNGKPALGINVRDDLPEALGEKIKDTDAQDSGPVDKPAPTKFAGTWTVVSAEVNGKQWPEDPVYVGKWVFTETGFTAWLPQEVKGGKFAFKLGTNGKLGTIDIEVLQSARDGGPKKQVYLGIYTLEGDNLALCYAPVGKERPKEFTTKSGGTLFVLKRDAQGKEPLSAVEVKKLIEQLGDKDFKLREEATRRLIDAGEAVLPALRDALATAHLETLQRLKAAIAAIEKWLPGTVEVAGVTLQLKLSAKDTTYLLDLGGLTEKAFQTKVAAAVAAEAERPNESPAFIGDFPPVPKLDLLLELRNIGKKHAAFLFGRRIIYSQEPPEWHIFGNGTALKVELLGPGVLAAAPWPANQPLGDREGYRPIMLDTGKHFDWPLKQLRFGPYYNNRNLEQRNRLYWTKAGEYAVRVTLTVGLDTGKGEPTPVTLSSNWVKIKVAEAK